MHWIAKSLNCRKRCHERCLGPYKHPRDARQWPPSAESPPSTDPTRPVCTPLYRSFHSPHPLLSCQPPSLDPLRSAARYFRPLQFASAPLQIIAFVPQNQVYQRRFPAISFVRNSAIYLPPHLVSPPRSVLSYSMITQTDHLRSTVFCFPFINLLCCSHSYHSPY